MGNSFEDYQYCVSEPRCDELEGDDVCAVALDGYKVACLPELSELCLAYEPHSVDCDGPEEAVAAAEQCQMDIDFYGELYGEVCREAAGEMYSCFASLECDESDGVECEAEVGIFLVSCK